MESLSLFLRLLPQQKYVPDETHQSKNETLPRQAGRRSTAAAV